MVKAKVFAAEGHKLTSGQRVKGMGDPKFLGLYSTNACSAMPFPRFTTGREPILMTRSARGRE